MLIAFMIDGVPDHIHFTKSENFEQVLAVREVHIEDVKSQELSLEQLIRLMDGDYKVFNLYLK